MTSCHRKAWYCRYWSFVLFLHSPSQRGLYRVREKRLQDLFLARAEMGTIAAERRVFQALRSEITPETNYKVTCGDEVRVHKEADQKWCEVVKVIRVRG